MASNDFSNEKQVRETARCVRTLLKTRGQSISLKELITLIENSDLSDPVALTQQVSQDLANRPATTTTRRAVAIPKIRKSAVISDWFVENYDVIHQCPEVEEGLLALVTRGRVAKDEQERRRAALIARATGTEDTDTTAETETTETETTTTVAPTNDFTF